MELATVLEVLVAILAAIFDPFLYVLKWVLGLFTQPELPEVFTIEEE